MSNTQNDGGSAFPVPTTHHPNGQIEYGTSGMTLRDYFAAHAIGNLITNKSVLEAADDAKQPISKVVASIAYDIADAMLNVREAKP